MNLFLNTLSAICVASCPLSGAPSPGMALRARSLPNGRFGSRLSPGSSSIWQDLRRVWEPWETSAPPILSLLFPTSFLSPSSISWAWVEKKSPKSPGEAPGLDLTRRSRETTGSRWETLRFAMSQSANCDTIPQVATGFCAFALRIQVVATLRRKGERRKTRTEAGRSKRFLMPGPRPRGRLASE